MGNATRWASSRAYGLLAMKRVPTDTMVAAVPYQRYGGRQRCITGVGLDAVEWVETPEMATNAKGQEEKREFQRGSGAFFGGTRRFGDAQMRIRSQPEESEQQSVPAVEIPCDVPGQALSGHVQAPCDRPQSNAQPGSGICSSDDDPPGV
ncbi:hypothetical protein L1887_53399 [Cichorium endivia]|nr:hypothetical protein L1887_53399 [Cichorium endivia]